MRVQINVERTIKQVWDSFTLPQNITQWNFASPDWCCPKAENGLSVGGKFNYRMEAKDGSFGFDFSGKYTEIIPLQKISYTLDDGRKVEVQFEIKESEVAVIEYFETETENSEELQKQGWQAILNNFKKYTETL